MAYSPNGRFIASGGEVIILWDANTLEKIARFEYPDRVNCLAFAPDGTWLASFDQDGYLIRWNLANYEQQWKVKAHSGSECLAISPNGKWLTNPWTIYESGEGQEVIRWDQMQAGL